MFAADSILVPVDFSSCSREGLQYAIGFASEFGARLILLHVRYLGYIYSSEGTALYNIPALQEAVRKNAERQMRQLVRSVSFGGIKFETAFTDGSPGLDICAFAKKHDVDLIITSTHGLTGFQHVLIGSVAEKVVRHAPCSVLVVPSHPKVRMANLANAGGRKTRTLPGSPRRLLRRTSGNHGNHREIRRSLEKIESWQRTRSPNGGRQTSFASRISDNETGVAHYQISNDLDPAAC